MSSLRWLLVTTLSLFAASNDSVTGDKIRSSLKNNQYIAHEWGTFTSLQGSDGVDQVGLHHGDEELPRFVHCPLGFSYSKCLSLLEPSETSPLATTQRMETPVIYFYSGTEKEVDVRVEFPNGVLTEWYPNATDYAPRAGQVNELKNGFMRWQTKIQTTEQEIPAVDPENIWQAQRQVDSNFVTIDNESDKFIFYRGIGRFTVPLRVTSDQHGITLKNSSMHQAPSVLMLDFDGERGAFLKLGPLPAYGEHKLSYDILPKASEGSVTEEYLAGISTLLHSELTAQGLYPQEASAMVNTWRESYFKTPGLRILYILPRAWTDQIVPLTLTPAPQELARVFVGRIEVFTAVEEQHLLTDVRTAIQKQLPAWEFSMEKLGRFTEPKLWRLKTLATNDTERKYISELVSYWVRPFDE